MANLDEDEVAEDVARLYAASCPRWGRVAASLQRQLDVACASLIWLAGYRPDSGERTKPNSQMQMDTITRVDGLINLMQPTPGDDVMHDVRECFRDVLSRSCWPNTCILPQGSGLVA